MSQHHRLAPLSRTPSSPPTIHQSFCCAHHIKALYHLDVGGQCYKPFDNQSIPLLTSSFFVLLPREASYLCITGSWYHFTSFTIHPALSRKYSKLFDTLEHDEKKEQIKVVDRKIVSSGAKWRNCII